MQEIAFFDLNVVQRFRDYVSFSLRYTFGQYICSSVGMGWMVGKDVVYYLNHVVVNDQYASRDELALVGIAHLEMQLVFEHPELDALTKRYLAEFYAKK